MSYTPTNWKSGDVVTSAKLNKLEQGVANAGGGALVVTATNGTLDKTYQEVHDAMASSGAVLANQVGNYTLFAFAGSNGLGQYHVDTAMGDEFYTDSADGYPSKQ
jgi:hypothetical protein